jgi:hypothetical protein
MTRSRSRRAFVELAGCAGGCALLAHCRELATCRRPRWVNDPKHRERVLEIQKDVLG